MLLVDPTLVSLISAGTALTASIAGPLVTLYVARVQIRAAVRSANRQKWIEEFRDTVAKFCGQIAVATQIRGKFVVGGRVDIPFESQALHQFEQLIYSASRIRLLINPHDPEHRHLLAAIDEIIDLLRSDVPGGDLQSEVRGRVMRITELCLGIIRKEWHRVQRGA